MMQMKIELPLFTICRFIGAAVVFRAGIANRVDLLN